MKKQIILGIDFSSKNIYISFLDMNGKLLKVDFKDKKSKGNHNEVIFYKEVLSLIENLHNYNAEYKIFVFMEKSIGEILSEIKGMIKIELIKVLGTNIRFYDLHSGDICKMLNFHEILELKEPDYFNKKYLNKDGSVTKKTLIREDMKKCFKRFALDYNLKNDQPQDYYDSFGIARTGFNLLEFYGEEWEEKIRKIYRGKKKALKGSKLPFEKLKDGLKGNG